MGEMGRTWSPSSLHSSQCLVGLGLSPLASCGVTSARRRYAQCMESSWTRQSCSPLPVRVAGLPGDPSGTRSVYHSAALG